MRLSSFCWTVLLLIMSCIGHTWQYPRHIAQNGQSHIDKNYDYDYVDANDGHVLFDNTGGPLNRFKGLDLPRELFYAAASNGEDCASTSAPETVCQSTTACATGSTAAPETTTAASTRLPPAPPCDHMNFNLGPVGKPSDIMGQLPQPAPQNPAILAVEMDDSEQRAKELRALVQHLYVAQARVQLEATEIRKAQAVAASAQSHLEEAGNHVRTITATLHNAQQEVAASAIRAQIAQLQLAAHDQLLFAARQDVDALSSQMVGLQAAEGIVQPRLSVDLYALLDKLRQPLQQFDRPTPVPTIVTLPPLAPFNMEEPEQTGGDAHDSGGGGGGGSVGGGNEAGGGAGNDNGNDSKHNTKRARQQQQEQHEQKPQVPLQQEQPQQEQPQQKPQMQLEQEPLPLQQQQQEQRQQEQPQQEQQEHQQEQLQKQEQHTLDNVYMVKNW